MIAYVDRKDILVLVILTSISQCLQIGKNIEESLKSPEQEKAKTVPPSTKPRKMTDESPKATPVKPGRDLKAKVLPPIPKPRQSPPEERSVIPIVEPDQSKVAGQSIKEEEEKRVGIHEGENAKEEEGNNDRREIEEKEDEKVIQKNAVEDAEEEVEEGSDEEEYTSEDEEEEEEGEDSDGVIVQASPSASRKSSGDGAGTSTIEITVASFTAAKGAKFLKNKKVHSLYVSSDASTCHSIV